MAVGDPVTDTCGAIVGTATTISSLQSAYDLTTGDVQGSSKNVNSVASLTLSNGEPVQVGMTITAKGSGVSTLNGGSWITSIDTGGCTLGPHCFVLNQNNTSSTTGANLTISGQYTILLNTATSATCGGNGGTQDTLKIKTAVYRLVGAMNTNTNTKFPGFTQLDDTIYLTAPSKDINTTTLGSSVTPFALASVPNGISVEAFGRCVGGSTDILIFNDTLVPGTPTSFTTVPGYAVNSATPATAYPFRTYTDTAKTVDAQAGSGTTNTLRCMTDGWVWRRGR